MRSRLNSALFLVMVMCGFVLGQPAARGETYIAGQAGFVVPNAVSNIEIDDPAVPPGMKASDLKLKNSIMYGAKVGHYFNSLRWLGVEGEVFNATPHIKQQDMSVGGFTAPDQPGANLRVTTLAFNLVARYPGERLQPYAGAGVGLFFARVNDKSVNERQTSTAPGLNTQVGLRYLLTQHVSLFGEWKYNYARFSVDPTPNLLGYNATYTAHHLVFGVGYHF
jgi:opacity protein-like surface antigen